VPFDRSLDAMDLECDELFWQGISDDTVLAETRLGSGQLGHQDFIEQGAFNDGEAINRSRALGNRGAT
jgi:hypothetical protein